jgi:hypothetical protein
VPQEENKIALIAPKRDEAKKAELFQGQAESY